MSNSKIPFLDLKGQYIQVKEEVFAAIERVGEITAFSDGPFVQEFETNFAKYCEAKYAVAVNNGTAALHLAMIALGINHDDEVIIPANTFIATAWGPTYVGAKPVFVDCDPDTWEIDIGEIEKYITIRTKAIIGVHLYGQPCQIEAIQAIADKHGIYFIEDAAQAHGACFKGKRIGSFGKVACFSFYPGKNLGAFGEGGAVTTNDEELYHKMRQIRNHGSTEKYYHKIIGYNMRMGGIEGASLNVKLKYLDGWNARRKEIAVKYQKKITNPKIKLQTQPENTDSVYHLFVITTENRDDLLKFLNGQNISPGLHYPVPCHLQEAYINLGYRKGDIPHSEYLALHCLSLPMFAELTDEQVNFVIVALNNY